MSVANVCESDLYASAYERTKKSYLHAIEIGIVSARCSRCAVTCIPKAARPAGCSQRTSGPRLGGITDADEREIFHDHLCQVA